MLKNLSSPQSFKRQKGKGVKVMELYSTLCTLFNFIHLYLRTSSMDIVITLKQQQGVANLP